MSESLINRRWKVDTEELGSGHVSTLRKAVDVKTKKVVAVKVEPKKITDPQLYHEYRVYQKLHRSSTPVIGIAEIYYYGRLGWNPALVMERLEFSLEDILYLHRGLSTKSTLMLGIQALKRLQYMHEKDLIHRDVAPENMMMGKKDTGRLYLIDFGCAIEYRSPDSYKVHTPYGEGQGLAIGTAEFASINAQRGIIHSRRDDLESLGYSLVYVNKAGLPWGGIVGPNSAERNRKILKIKQSTSRDRLCENMPHQMAEYFRSVRKLEFAEKPDYPFLIGLFTSALNDMGHVDDRKFEWTAGGSSKDRRR